MTVPYTKNKLLIKSPKPSYLFVLPWEITDLGGVNQVVINLCHEIQSHNHYEPVLLLNDWSAKKIQHSLSEGIKTGSFRLRSPHEPKAPVKNLLLYFVTAPLSLFKLFRFMRMHNIQVINPHFPGLNSLAFVWLKRLGLFRGKLILSVHGLDISNASKSQGMEKMWWKLLFRSADALVACSQSLAEAVCAFVPPCKNQIVVVHNGINVDRLTTGTDGVIDVDNLPPKQPFILNVGTFEHKKGQDTLIRAFREVHRVFPEFCLVVIGRSGKAEQSLQRLVAGLELSNHVVLIRDLPHPRVAAFLDKARLFVLSSREEPFGIVLLEAGVFGLPVIATAVGGVPEILEHDVTAYLVPPDDVSAMAAKIISLLETPAESKRLATNLRSHVAQNFSWERAYQKYIRIITVS